MVGVCEEECMGRSLVDETEATVVGSHSYMKPLGASLSVAEPTT